MSGPDENAVVFGVLNETDQNETRVALTPDMVTRLSKQKITCLVESGAGAPSRFEDDDYRQAGAKITDKSTVLAEASVLGFVDRPTWI